MSCACAHEVMFTQPPATISLLILLDSCKLHHKYPLRSHLTLYWPCVIIMHLVCIYTSCMYCSSTTKGSIYFFLFQAPAWFSSLCIFSLKSAARNESIANLQLAHSEEHHPQVEKVLTCLLTDLCAEERRIRRERCTLESVLVCPCIEVLPVSGSDCAMLGLVVVANCYYNVQSVASACLSSSCCRPFHSHIMYILIC